MADNPFDADIEPDIDPIIAEMHSQNDRGVAICGGAFLEEKLQEAIEERWLPICNTLRDRLFKGFGPLSSFSAKITLAQAMGILTHSAKSDFDKIRQIRNHAAHVGTPFSFNAAEIQKRLGELNALNSRMPMDQHSDSQERNQFTGSIKLMASYLWFQNRFKTDYGHDKVLPYFGSEKSSKKRRQT